MKRIKLARAQAAGVVTLAVLNMLAALSMPVPERKTPLLLIVASFALLLAHAAVYEFGDRMRRRFGLTVYAGAQALILFAIALWAPPPITVVLYMVAVAELVTLAGSAWGTVRITIAAIVLLVVASFITSNLYRAATFGVVLAATGLIAHAVAGLLQRRVVVGPGAAAPIALANGAPPLSAREVEVLRELVRGARNGDIAAKLNISERTVKAHLGSIYQKLGVTSRTAAIAAAGQLKLW